MGFFKKLFSRGEPFIPTPTQQVPGLDPIVVQAVENLFLDRAEQIEVFKDLLEKSKGANTLILLSLLEICGQNIDSYRAYMKNPCITTPIIGTSAAYYISRDGGFSKMKDAEKWVKSITRS